MRKEEVEAAVAAAEEEEEATATGRTGPGRPWPETDGESSFEPALNIEAQKSRTKEEDEGRGRCYQVKR